MQKEITITLNINDKHKKMLEEIRWKHIDIDRIMKEELQNNAREIISSIIEEVYYGI